VTLFLADFDFTFQFTSTFLGKGSFLGSRKLNAWWADCMNNYKHFCY
jgi:hypothetical protein